MSSGTGSFGSIAVIAVGAILAAVVVAVVTRDGGDSPPSASAEADAAEVASRQLASGEDVQQQVRSLIRAEQFTLFGDSTVDSVSCRADLPINTGEPFTCDVVFGRESVLHFEVAFVDRHGTIGWCAARSAGGDAFNQTTSACNDQPPTDY